MKKKGSSTSLIRFINHIFNNEPRIWVYSLNDEVSNLVKCVIGYNYCNFLSIFLQRKTSVIFVLDTYTHPLGVWSTNRSCYVNVVVRSTYSNIMGATHILNILTIKQRRSDGTKATNVILDYKLILLSIC